MVPITEYRCNNLAQFLKHVAEEIDRQPNEKQATVLLWRGQSRSEWRLWPNLQVMWQGRADGLLEAEQKAFEDFSKAAPYLMPTSVSNDWDRLSVAQHYGMSTRLLDWTVNPLLALWFSLSAPADCDGAVWALRPQHVTMLKDNARTRTSPFEIKNTRIFRPTMHSPRVAMQAGWHTVHRFDSTRGGLRALDSMNVHRRCLAKFIIPRDKRTALFEQLEGMGVSVANAFGDLPSLCKHLSTKYAAGVRADRSGVRGS